MIEILGSISGIGFVIMAISIIKLYKYGLSIISTEYKSWLRWCITFGLSFLTFMIPLLVTLKITS